VHFLGAIIRKMKFLRSPEEALHLQSRVLAESNVWFDAALNNTSQGLCMFDETRKLVVSNLWAQQQVLAPANRWDSKKMQ